MVWGRVLVELDTLRFTWRQETSDPDALIAAVLEAMELASAA